MMLPADINNTHVPAEISRTFLVKKKSNSPQQAAGKFIPDIRRHLFREKYSRNRMGIIYTTALWNDIAYSSASA